MGKTLSAYQAFKNAKDKEAVLKTLDDAVVLEILFEAIEKEDETTLQSIVDVYKKENTKENVFADLLLKVINDFKAQYIEILSEMVSPELLRKKLDLKDEKERDGIKNILKNIIEFLPDYPVKTYLQKIIEPQPEQDSTNQTSSENSNLTMPDVTINHLVYLLEQAMKSAPLHLF